VANENHIRRLKQGVDAWNTWRSEHYADVDLSGAELNRANLTGVDLRGANLAYVDLSVASLNGANLSRADLTGANLNGTFLTRTDLTYARLYETIFADVDLASVIGLEKCDHLGPSIVDHRTLQKSGPLPLSFLRGVGLPDKSEAIDLGAGIAHARDGAGIAPFADHTRPTFGLRRRCAW
jgi:uncharacterized protein YjbI with pentapeptide repeats